MAVPGGLGQADVRPAPRGNPRAIVTTTPRPTPLTGTGRRSRRRDPRQHLGEPARISPLLPPKIVRPVRGNPPRAAGTRGRNPRRLPGALWSRAKSKRLAPAPNPNSRGSSSPSTRPSPRATGRRDRHHRRRHGSDGHGYLLADIRAATPDRMGARRDRRLSSSRADRIVAETNNGGEMVEPPSA